MNRGLAFAVVVAGLLAATAAASMDAMPGVGNPERARVNWILKCQGCHLPGADTAEKNAPPLANEVSRFLTVPGGREYLARVPGVATTALADEALAELVNWMLIRFDPQHLPSDFKPYSPEEIGEHRQRPLRIEATAIRVQLLRQLREQDARDQAQTEGRQANAGD